MLYYFSGFLGYVILANYIKRFYMQPGSSSYVTGLVLIACGYAITAYGFLHLLPTEDIVPKLEITWGFETINVVMITAGIFIIAKNIATPRETSPFKKLIDDISAKSYGIYLAHIMVLNTLFPLIDPTISSAAIKLPVIALCTFITTYIIIKCLSYLPKSKVWLGS